MTTNPKHEKQIRAGAAENPARQPSTAAIRRGDNQLLENKNTQKIRRCLDSRHGQRRIVSKKGGDLLSRLRSTIGAHGLNCSVRNGKRWNPGAMTTLNKDDMSQEKQEIQKIHLNKEFLQATLKQPKGDHPHSREVSGY